MAHLDTGLLEIHRGFKTAKTQKH